MNVTQECVAGGHQLSRDSVQETSYGALRIHDRYLTWCHVVTQFQMRTFVMSVPLVLLTKWKTFFCLPLWIAAWRHILNFFLLLDKQKWDRKDGTLLTWILDREWGSLKRQHQPVSQYNPVNPVTHEQWNPSTSSVQFPPFPQVTFTQSSTSAVQNNFIASLNHIPLLPTEFSPTKNFTLEESESNAHFRWQLRIVRNKGVQSEIWLFQRLVFLFRIKRDAPVTQRGAACLWWVRAHWRAFVCLCVVFSQNDKYEGTTVWKKCQFFSEVNKRRHKPFVLANTCICDTPDAHLLPKTAYLVPFVSGPVSVTNTYQSHTRFRWILAGKCRPRFPFR